MIFIITYIFTDVYTVSPQKCLVRIKYDIFQAPNRGPKTSLILCTLVWHLVPVDIHFLNTLILFHYIFLVLFVSILFLKKRCLGLGRYPYIRTFMEDQGSVSKEIRGLKVICTLKSICGRPEFS